MASIKKRPNGTFQATVFVGRDANGKQLFKYITKPSEKECKAAARKVEQELEDKKFIDTGKVRLAAWVDEWIELNRGRLSPSTVVLYKIYAKSHYKPYFGDMKLSQVNEIHIRRFMAEKLKTLKPSTVRKLMFVLSKILREILKDKNPCKDVIPPADIEFKPHVITEEEFEQIHNAVRGTKDEPIVLLSAWCGLRRGEIFALKWDDVNWEKELIRIDESRCITDEGRYTDKDPKSDNGFREVVVPTELMNLLRDLRKSKSIVEIKIKPRVKAKPKVKVKSTVKPNDKSMVKFKVKPVLRIWNNRPDNYSSYWAEMVVTKKMPKVRFHDLRHYHASWLYNHDIPDQYAAKHMGHDIRILKAIYQHLDLKKEIEIDDKIRQLYNAPCPTECPTKTQES